uniref:Uncharacterized protein n=1 Tax=Arundo donax TaxID=35708 RepID=A0A0A9BQG5_ARUDO
MCTSPSIVPVVVLAVVLQPSFLLTCT